MRRSTDVEHGGSRCRAEPLASDRRRSTDVDTAHTRVARDGDLPGFEVADPARPRRVAREPQAQRLWHREHPLAILHENATTISSPHAWQRTRAKPCARSYYGSLVSGLIIESKSSG